ncbi:MAG: PrsW family glutamic-type intramembrane protease [Candidatus Kapabacteria bacterium]|nr:PrsW family glutamic-type intramembrane protease [Candidatus Kapabacteria bacterium]
MYFLISLIMALAPAFFLLWYFNRMDKAKPEPKGMIIKIFLWGIFIIIPAIIIELFIDNFYSTILGSAPVLYIAAKSFIVAGMIEEGLKLWVVLQFAYKNVNFDEAMDGIVYAIVASMGFAAFENVIYVMGHGMEVAILRAFTSLPLHAVATGIMGYYIGQARFVDDSRLELKLIVKGFFIAVFIHGLYNFLIFGIEEFGYIPALLNIPLLIGCFIYLRKLIKSAIADDKLAGRQEIQTDT